ncbi:MAG: bifunctional folylpolyglutamate synthase/dihydrofolate synthase [Blautia sp.]|nr:bifunctional folylpolyglutamate synthase/dihydrofolate synthase [Lachnoclostridium sp.]MCM1210267.1 bifunctional folylpolyglutamate synthase/dihydrofolate synthase [Blautia sp.]
MNYREAMEYVESLQQYGVVPGLETMRHLCALLGNPQDKLQFIHIAGTNGKGSVLAYLSTILQTAGYRVGRYISPTILDYRERFQIDAKPITKQGFCKYLEQVQEASRQMVEKGMPHPTPFETETAVAFLYFLDKKCDVVVLETGLGGRLDATNIIRNTVCAVLTSISMDHMALLGGSLEEIAAQKAGIIKDGCLVVSAPQKEEAYSVIAEEAREHHCDLFTVDAGAVSQIKYGLKKQRFSYQQDKNMEIALAGQYQIDNAVLALEVIHRLRERGFAVSGEQLRSGLVQTVWLGRFSIIGKSPLFVIDGAHNEDAAKKLAQSIRFYFTNRRIIYIMGVLKDKEYEQILIQTHALAEHIITVTPPHNARALSGYELAQTAGKYHPSVTVADSLQEAVELAYLLAGRDKGAVVIAFGTLTILGELIHIVEHRDTIRRDSHGKSEED